MRKLILHAILSIFPVIAWGEVNPEVIMPNNFNSSQFVENSLSGDLGDYNSVSTGGCGNVKYKNFTFLSNQKNIESDVVKEWTCLFGVDVKRDGYVAGDLLPEKINFNSKTGMWDKKNHTLTKSDIKDALKVYGIKNINELHPIDVYNIQTPNAKGYVVIDSNIPISEPSLAAKGKIISLCLIHPKNDVDFALCGYGRTQIKIDDKDIDLTPYVLKSVESLEMDTPEDHP